MYHVFIVVDEPQQSWGRGATLAAAIRKVRGVCGSRTPKSKLRQYVVVHSEPFEETGELPRVHPVHCALEVPKGAHTIELK